MLTILSLSQKCHVHFHEGCSLLFMKARLKNTIRQLKVDSILVFMMKAIEISLG